MADAENGAALAGILRPEHVFAGLRVASKAALLGEFSRRTAAVAGVPAATILAALEKRETLGSTGVGGGIAIPHARLSGLAVMTAGFARLERAIDYAAVDGAPVDLVFLLLTPEEAATKHLAVLAAISRRLRDRQTQAALRSARSAAELRAGLLA